jgi:formamidopyrimidine-DNA glycosylase
MVPDVVDEEFTVDYLQQVLKRSIRAVKLVILDQDKMGGMGNIYANDALYLAKIHPLKKANSLTRSEVVKLHQAMITVIHKGIETGGASYSHFVDTEGVGGHYQDHFLVYDKKASQCQKCHSVIEKINVGGRGTYFCPKCQMLK